MWITFYNPKAAGDVLLLTREAARSEHLPIVESKENVTCIKNEETNKINSINIFNISSSLPLQETGVVTLSNEDQKTVNDIIQQAGFDVEVVLDEESKFVVGYVEEIEPVEGSDHLNKTQTRVGSDEVLQIVCGASNIDQGQSVIVAKPGAVMPNGMIIWPGELRGVESHGMVCSTRELDLTHIENEDGIWVLPEGFEPGTLLEDVVSHLSK